MVHGLETMARLNAEASKPPGSDVDQIRSLQRELAEARAERDKWRSDYRRYSLDDGAVAFVPCQDLRTAAFGSATAANPAIKDSLTTAEPAQAQAGSADHFCPYHGKAWCHCKPAPGPSDAKGEKLTPLTDPSVRGVLVDDGEPRHLGYGDLYLSDGNLVAWDDVEYASAEKYQPVKLRPASEFGVDARGEPGLKPLPDGAHVIIPHDESAPGFRVAYLDGWWQVLDSTLYGTADQAERIKDLEGELKTAREKINRLRMDSSRELRLEAAALWSTNTMLQSDLARLRKAIEEAYDMLANRGLAGAIAAQQTLLRALTPSPAASGAAPGSADYDRGVECDPAPAAESASEMFRSLGQKMFARQYNDPPQALSEVIAERDQLRKRAEDAEANVMALVEQVRKLEGKAGVQDGPKTSD